MKAKNYVFLSLFLLFGTSSSIYAQCGVEASDDAAITCGGSTQLNMEPKWSPQLDNTPLSGVFFVNDDEGYAVGGPGIIRKTTDGGKNWVAQTSGTNYSLLSVFFTNPLTGYIVGNLGGAPIILKTTDGGDHWVEKVSNSPNSFMSVYFTSADTGITAGPNGTIMKTVDAGETWTQKTSNASASAWLSCVHFANAKTGYVVGGGALLKTIDGGETWFTLPGNNSGLAFGDVFFTDPQTGYATGFDGVNAIIYKTTDGGMNWSWYKTTLTDALQTIIFTDGNTGYTAGGNKILKTTDAGATWKMETVANTYINCMHFPNSKTGYAVGDKTIKYSTPDDITWSPSTGLNSSTIPNPIANPIVTTKYKVTTTTGGCIATDSVTVTVNPFTIDAGADKTLVCGGNAQLDNVTSNYTGTGTLTYSWSPVTGLNAANSANPIVTITQTTKYYVTVITPNGCTATDSITVTVNPFKANAGSDKILSCGNTVQFDQVTSNYTGTGNLTYVWTPATGLNSATIPNPTVTIKQTATYAVTVTTPNGCTSVDSVTVFVGPLTAEAGADKTIVCGAAAQLGITTNYSGGGGLTYAWSPSTGLNLSYLANPVATPLQTTKYYVNITTPNGCTAMDSITVIVNPLTVDAGIDKTIICGGSAQMGIITNYSGTGSPTYKWSPTTGLSLSNIANPTAIVTQNTAFVITVLTLNGCSAVDTVNVIVDPLIAEAGPDKTITCGGEGQLLVTTNYTGSGTLTYGWTPTAGLNLSNIANPIVNVSQTTKFNISVKTANGCVAKDSLTVLVNPLTVNAGSDKSHICGASIQLDSAITNYTGNGILTYSWSPKTGLNNSTIPNPVSNGAATYTLTVISPYGNCKTTDQVNVSIAPLAGEEICMVTLDSTNKNVVLWNKQELSLIDSFLVYKETAVAGNYVKIGSVHKSAPFVFKDINSKPDVSSNKYRISIKDSCGVETPLSIPHKTMHLSINKGVGISWNLIWEGYEGFAVSSYIIYRGTDPKNLQFLDATSGSNTQYTDNNPPKGDVYYQLEVVKPTACNPAKPINSTRSNVASTNPVGIDELTTSVSFSLYPNPASDQITINIEAVSIKNMTLNIYNTIGALVKTIPVEQNNQQVAISELSNGFYTVELRSNQIAAKQKLTIHK